MKIIDLLNKIANGEEIKAKLKFKLGDIIITYYGTNNYYKTPEYNIEYIDKGCTTHDFNLGMIIKHLNDEVEILEEEPRDIEVCGSLFTKSEYDKLAHCEEEKKIPEKLNIEDDGNTITLYGEKENEWTILDNVDVIICNKINSIIDYLKSKGE